MTIANNDITSNSNQGYPLGNSGIRVQNISESNGISCNTLDGFDAGMSFDGMCDKTRLTSNYFNEHEIGLRLVHGNTIMGRQRNRLNKWYEDQPSTDEALFVGAGTDPNSFMISASQFWIANSTTTSDDWPDPVSPDLEDPPTTGWFINAGTAPSQVVCVEEQPADPSEPTFAAQGIIDDIFPTISGKPAIEWNVEYFLFSEFYKYSSLKTSDQDYIDWYDDYEESPAGKLFLIERAIMDLPEGTENPDTLLAELDSISTSDDIEENLIEVMEIYLNAYDSGVLEYSGTDSTSLVSLAGKCPYTDGRAVFIARAMLDLPDVYEEDLCSSERTNFNSVNVLPNAKLSPNPSTGVVILTLAEEIKNGEIEVNTILGTEVLRSELKFVDYVELDLSNEINGLYFVTIRDYTLNTATSYSLVLEK